MALSIGQRLGEAVVAAAFAALGAYMVWASGGMPAGTLSLPGPGFLPTALGVALIAIGGLLAASSLLGRRGGGAPVRIDLFATEVVVALLALAAVALAFAPAGAFLTLAAFLIALIKTFARVSWLRAASGGIVLALLAVLFFRALLGVPLPRGLLY